MPQPTIQERFDPAIAERVIQLSNGSPGIGRYLGIELTRVEAGAAFCHADLTDELVTLSGNVHGGALAAIVDHITGCAIYPLIPDGHWGATTELKLNYVSPVKPGRLHAQANVLAMARRSAVVRAEAYVGQRLACAAQGTISIVAPSTNAPV